ncbi:MAG: tetratricopeptide repeat protein [Gammaproteobacteria bacterium]|nr:tetratricopeptide repeat protein [Gammaproteobacteria bacterium]
MTFFAELKRRNVIRVAILYLVSAWVLLQLTDVLSSLLTVPPWAGSLVVMLLALGFVPALLFSWVYEMTPEGLKLEKDVDRSGSITHESGRKINTLITVLLVIAIAGLIADRLVPEKNSASPLASDQAAPERSVPAEMTKADDALASIAVLPFDDLSAAQDQRYFTDGISEELLNVLARVDGLRVASRTSAFTFRGKNLDIPEIARELGVATVLEGSVRKDGNRIRITAQLIDGATDRHLWSQTYDRDLVDIFKIQDEIANAIVDSLKDKLGIKSAGKIVNVVAATDNLDAYELFLKAQALFQARQNLPAGVQLFTRATELDPGFARAWAGLASTLAVFDDWVVDDIDHKTLARAAAQRALELDPDLSMPYAVLANIGLSKDSISVMLDRYDTAIAKDPKNATAWLWRGILHSLTGFPDRALADLEQCLRVDPEYLNCQQYLAATYLQVGEIDRAVALYEETLGSSFHSMDEVFIPEYLDRGQIATALLIADARSWSSYAPVGEMIKALQHPDADHSDGIRRFERWSEETGNTLESVPFVMLALRQYAHMASLADTNDIRFLMWYPMAAEYRHSPEFKQFARALGLPDYWRETGYPPQCRALGTDDFECE